MTTSNLKIHYNVIVLTGATQEGGVTQAYPPDPLKIMKERISRMKCGGTRQRDDDESDNRLEMRDVAGVTIPEEAWGRNFWAAEPTKRKPLKPTVCQSLSLIPLGYRMWRRVRDEKSRGVGQFMDPFSDWQHDTSHGVPLGGIGCGSFGRGWRGDFRRYSTGSSTTGVVYITEDTPHTGFSICTSTPSSKIPDGRVLKVASPSDNPTSSVRYVIRFVFLVLFGKKGALKR